MLKYVLFVLTVLLSSSPLAADTFQLTATMSGDQETVPTASLATGFANVTLDSVTHLFSWTVGFSGPFLGTPTAMHFHGRLASDPATQGAPGSNAGVRIGLGVAANPNVGSVDLTTIAGYGPFMDADILAGLWYVNLHTNIFPAGEIRGQLQVVPEPASVMLLLSCLAGIALVRPRKRA